MDYTPPRPPDAATLTALDHIRIVLVGTSHPGNIGAAARAMKTMCLSRLYLVTPRRFPSAEATALASGSDDILHQAQVCQSLDEAVADCAAVIGASARVRTIPWPLLGPRDCAQLALDTRARGEVALVFGREDSGLTNDELERCTALVHISANPRYSSLNIAAAVQVLSHELLQAQLAREDAATPHAAEVAIPLATSDDMRQFYEHLEQAMIAIGFLDPAHPRHMMRRMQRLFNRAQLDKNEYNMLRGVLAAVRRRGE